MSFRPEDDSLPHDDGKEEDIPPETDDVLSSAEVIEAWNKLADDCGLPKIARMTESRKRQLAARIRDHPFEDWAAALAAVRRSPFCKGDNPRGWRANFDFLLQPSSFTKLLEGHYDDQATSR